MGLHAGQFYPQKLGLPSIRAGQLVIAEGGAELNFLLRGLEHGLCNGKVM